MIAMCVVGEAVATFSTTALRETVQPDRVARSELPSQVRELSICEVDAANAARRVDEELLLR